MRSYNVTVTYINGHQSVFPGVKAHNKRDAKNLVIAELFNRGISHQDVKSIKVEIAATND